MPVLTDNAYRRALRGAGICLNRARLYAPQLDWARDVLVAISNLPACHAANIPAPHHNWFARLQAHRGLPARGLNMNYNVFAPALSGSRLVKLIVNLAKQLDPWAAAEIFVQRQPGGLGLAAAANSYNNLINAVATLGFPANAPYAYTPYAAAPPIPEPGVGALAATGALPAALNDNILKTTGHFINNIRNCSNRIFAHWGALNEAFSPVMPWMPAHNPPTFEHVEALIPTGSDYHKGGQQVVLVDFGLCPGCVGPTKRTNLSRNYGWRYRLARNLGANANVLGRGEYGVERVVYKPGDLELDCRILGDSAVVNAIAPSGYNQAQSLFELFNANLGEPVERQLPNYVILPYNPGSLLPGINWGAAHGAVATNIRHSYGFSQFLTHTPDAEGDLGAPALPNMGQLRNKLRDYGKPNWQADNDYISTDPAHPVNFYYVWGQIMAIASTFSLSDLHRQNTIVHRHPYPRNAPAYPHAWSPKPHPIDVEDGFKWPMSSLEMTGIPNSNLLKSVETEVKAGVVNEGTVNITVNWVDEPWELTKNQAFNFNPANNQLYHLKPNVVHKRAMCEGFLKAMEAMRGAAFNGACQNWVNTLTNTLTRFVIVATADFYKQMFMFRTGFMTMPGTPATMQLVPMMLQSREMRIRLTRSDWNLKIALPNMTAWQGHPVIAIEHDHHNFFDFNNLDIPFYMRRLGNSELLNSQGQRVIVNACIADQNAWDAAAAPAWNLPAPAANTLRTTPLGAAATVAQITSYFPESGITFVNRQLQNLLAAADPAFFQRTTRMLEEVLDLTGLKLGAGGGAPVAAETIPGDTVDPLTAIPAAGIDLDGAIATSNPVVDRPVGPQGFVYQYRPPAPPPVAPPPVAPGPPVPPPAPPPTWEVFPANPATRAPAGARVYHA